MGKEDTRGWDASEDDGGRRWEDDGGRRWEKSEDRDIERRQWVGDVRGEL